MSKNFKDSEITEELAKYVWKGSQSFANGIYVPTSEGEEGHPCGWDFISFEDMECSDDVECMPIEAYSISNGYGSEIYQGMTLLEILQECHGRVAFEKDQIDW